MKAYSLVLVVVLGFASCLRVDSQPEKPEGLVARFLSALGSAPKAIIGAPRKFINYVSPQPCKHLYPSNPQESYTYITEGQNKFVETSDPAGRFAFDRSRLQSREKIDSLLRVVRIDYVDDHESESRQQQWGQKLRSILDPPALGHPKHKHSYKLDRRWVVEVFADGTRSKHVQSFSFIASGGTVTVGCGKEKATVKRGLLWGVPARFFQAVRRQKPVLPFVIAIVGDEGCYVKVSALDSYNVLLAPEVIEEVSDHEDSVVNIMNRALGGREGPGN